MDPLAMQWQFLMVSLEIAVAISAVWMYIDARH